MRKNFLVALSLIFSNGSMAALSGPYADFAFHVATIAESQNANASTWSGGFTYEEPPGGLVYRGFYDINGDGKDEIILLSSVNVPYASIYESDVEGKYSKITDEAILYSFNFSVSKKDDVNQIVSIAHQRHFASVAYNRFSPSGNLSVERNNIDSNEADTAELSQFGMPATAQRTQKITLMELVLSATPYWDEADPVLRVQGQSYRMPELSKDIQQAFTPQYVLSKIKQLTSVKQQLVTPETKKAKQMSTSSSNMHFLPTSSATATTKIQSERKFWSLSITVFVIVIAPLVIMAVFRGRNNS